MNSLDHERGSVYYVEHHGHLANNRLRSQFWIFEAISIALTTCFALMARFITTPHVCVSAFVHLQNKIRLSYLGAVRPFAFVLSTVHIRTFACCDDLLQLGIMIISTTFNLISLGVPLKQHHSSLMRLLLAWKKVLPPPHYCGCRRGQVGLRRSCLAPRGCWWPPSTQRRWSSRWRR